MRRVRVRKGAVIAQTIASGALGALVLNMSLVPPKYQLLAVMGAGGLLAVLPSPLTKKKASAE